MGTFDRHVPPTGVIAEFASEYHTLNRITPVRARQQINDLRHFEAWLASTGRSLYQARAHDISAYMAHMMERGVKASTTRTVLYKLRPFYRWASQRTEVSGVTVDDWQAIRALPAPRGSNVHRPRPYNRLEIARMREQLAHDLPNVTDLSIKRWINGTSSFAQIRRHVVRVQTELVIALAVELGLRRAEIYHLSVDDMHPDNAIVVVYRKRSGAEDKVQEIPMTESVRAQIERWFWFRRRLAPTHDSPWLSLRGPNYNGAMSWRIYCGLLGFGDGWELHRLRHTCITERLRNGMPIQEVQELAGHATIEQTRAYCEVERHDIARSLEAQDPAFLRAIGRAA